MKKIRVLLVDDHTMVRQGLKVLLEAEPGIEVIAEAENGRQALELTRLHRPGVVVMDIAMPLLNGMEATRQIMHEMDSVRVLVLSSYSDDEYVRQVTTWGAAGFLLKQTASADLIRAVREVAKGNAFFSPTISSHLARQYRDAFTNGTPVRQRADKLTSREAEILQLIAEGLPNKQIADELGISVKTVEKHRQQVMNKLDIHDIAGLTRFAITKGLIELGRDMTQ